MSDEHIDIRWAGTVVRVRVLRRYKNGRIRVEMLTNGWVGRPGTVHRETMTVEPWQEVKQKENSE